MDDFTQAARAKQFRRAHGSRALVSASRRNELLPGTRCSYTMRIKRKVRERQMPSPACEPRALPRPDLSAAFFFQGSYFLLQQPADAMSRQIHLADIDPQSRGDFLCRPFFAHVTIKNL